MVAGGRHLGIVKVKVDGRDPRPGPVLPLLAFNLSKSTGCSDVDQKWCGFEACFRGKVKKCCRLRQISFSFLPTTSPL